MEKLISHNPTTGDIIGEIEKTPLNNISTIVKNSKEAQEKWANLFIYLF